MVKHTQTIRRKLTTNCLSVFDHFVGLAVKGLNESVECLQVTQPQILPKKNEIVFKYFFITFSNNFFSRPALMAIARKYIIKTIWKFRKISRKMAATGVCLSKVRDVRSPRKFVKRPFCYELLVTFTAGFQRILSSSQFKTQSNI